MTRAPRLRRPSARLGPLLIRWLFQGTRLALLLGLIGIGVLLVLWALVAVALLLWPVVLGGSVVMVLWTIWRFRQRSVPPPLAVGSGALPISRVRDALPPSVQERIARIRAKAEALVDRATSSKDQHLVQSTLDDYLPRAVDAYLALPPGSAAWPVTPDGRTGQRVLEDQLDLIERNLDEITGHVWQQGTRRLLAHERFLEERLGVGPSEDLEIRR